MVFLEFSLRNSSYDFVANEGIYNMVKEGRVAHKNHAINVTCNSLVGWPTREIP